jgi:UDP-N-acetylmuramoyl-tripeptide--D-alanyl-D-alanine ligase
MPRSRPHPAMAQVAVVHCVGPADAATSGRRCPSAGAGWVRDGGRTGRRVHRLVDAGDVVLVKGSKGSKVSRVVDAIRKLGHAAPRPGQGGD